MTPSVLRLFGGRINISAEQLHLGARTQGGTGWESLGRARFFLYFFRFFPKFSGHELNLPSTKTTNLAFYVFEQKSMHLGPKSSQDQGCLAGHQAFVRISGAIFMLMAVGWNPYSCEVFHPKLQLLHFHWFRNPLGWSVLPVPYISVLALQIEHKLFKPRMHGLASTFSKTLS